MRPVRFRESIEHLYRDGVRVFIEVGPESHLTAFVRDILRNRTHVATSCDDRRRGADQQLRHLLGQLFAQGVSVDLEPLYGGTPQPATEPAPYLSTAIPIIQPTEPVVAQLRECLDAAIHLPHSNPPPAITQPLGRSGALTEHFDLMQEFLRQQERVMSAWLDRRRER
jgi:acyl transferase domain-containing protein